MIRASKWKYLLLSIILVFILLIISICIFIFVPWGAPVKTGEPNSIYEAVKDGDIICRLGNRSWSQIFRNASVTDKRFSHMGVVCIKDDFVSVIHAEGNSRLKTDYVNEVSLDDFIGIARATGVYRVKEIDGNKISNTAREFIGVPFDWKFDLNDESKIYCTELLYAILKRIKPGFQLQTVYAKSLKTEIIPLEAISNSRNFTEVFYVRD